MLDHTGALEGILCLDDIVLFAEEKVGELSYTDVVDTLKSICEHTSAFQALAVAR